MSVQGRRLQHFFPALLKTWQRLEKASSGSPVLITNKLQVSPRLAKEFEQRAPNTTVLEGDDIDHPPFVELCVGRERELELLNHTDARVVFLTGIGDRENRPSQLNILKIARSAKITVTLCGETAKKRANASKIN